jgi:polynucleotide 5'-hydroxyl-kinase GRC3/NOL9
MGREGMSESWADVVADRIVGTSPLGTGKLLLLGAADTGKTTLLDVLVSRLARRQRVAVVDADVGQSHIGPPTTVGWMVFDGKDGPAAPSWEIRGIPPEGGSATGGIAFVGDVTPVGHLLQLLAALALCVEQAAQAARVVLIDTPGLVAGGAACSLWWTVQRLLRPERIVALQREHELAELLVGLQAGLSAIERIEVPAQLQRKSPEARQVHRSRLFEEYFRNATAHTLDVRDRAVRFPQRMRPEDVVGRVVGLTDAAGWDLAIGVVERWRSTKITIRAPQLDVQRVRCLTIGAARIDIPLGRSG